MIFINLNQVDENISYEARQSIDGLSDELKDLPQEDIKDFIKANREKTWRHPELLEALQSVVGNKCWYTEIPLEGADSNVDHFRPKGRVLEIDPNKLERTGVEVSGYWWLAFERSNFRLTCMHANQRRVDQDTEGGKADFFPVLGPRAVEKTDWDLIEEVVLPLDPCSLSDVGLIWYNPEGKAVLSKSNPTEHEELRLKVTIWLYHLEKREVLKRRKECIEEIIIDLKSANTSYKLWNPNSNNPNMKEKQKFDREIASIKQKISDNSRFAGAKRSIVRLEKAKYSWIDEINLI